MTDEHEPGRPAGGPIRFEAAVGDSSRSSAIAVSIVLVFVVAAILKPWEALTPRTQSPVAEAPPRAAGAAASARASGSAAWPRPGAAAVQTMCLNAISWRSATIEQWDSDQTVRVWRALDPRPASGPTDPAIDVVPAVGETVPAIGYCAPPFGPDSPGPAEVVAWRVEGDVATPIELRQVVPVGVVSQYGALFGPPDRGAGWPAGMYVFRHAERAAGASPRWFAVEVRTARRADAGGRDLAVLTGLLP